MRKLFVGATLIVSGALGAGAAHAADSGLQWSIVIGTPVYTPPAPVYVRPSLAYRAPAPGHARAAHLHPTRWDRDGDGIPNHRDRLYNPPWDRDGDGIANRHDRHPDRARPGR